MSRESTQNRSGDSGGQTPAREYVISTGDYLAEEKKWDIIKDAVEHQGNIVILSPPNSGKSQAAIEGLKDLNFVFVADTKALAEDLASKHKLGVYHADNQNIDTTQSFITIPFHAPKFASKDRILVVDEWHSLLTDYGYRDKHIEPFVDSMGKWKQVIGMTGTRVLPIKQFPEWTVKYETPRHVTIHHISEYTDLASTIASSILRNPNRQHWVSVFEKEKLPDQIGDLLRKNGFEKEEIVPFDADNLGDERIKQFLKNNVFPKTVKVVFTTFKQGFSIRGHRYMLHIVPRVPDRRHSPLDIAQVSQRFRDLTDPPLIYLYWKFSSKQIKVRSGAELRREWEKEHKSREAYYKRVFSVEEDSIPSEDQIKLIRFIEKNKDFKELKLGRFQDMFRKSFDRNDIMLGYEIYRQNTRKAYSSFDVLKRTLMKEYGCILVKGKRIPNLKESTSLKRRGIDDATFKEAVEKLSVSGNGKVDVHQRLQYLIRFMKLEDAVVAYKEYSWSHLKKMIVNQGKNREETNIVRAVLKEAFPEGSHHSNQQIRSTLLLLSEQYTELTEGAKKTYPIQFLMKHFSTAAKRRNGDRVHEIVSHEPLTLDPLTTVDV